MKITAIGEILVDMTQTHIDGNGIPHFNEYVRFANKAASITTSRPGAIPAMPTLQEVKEGLH
jgi:fructokinase